MSGASPAVSVIVATYHCPVALKAALESVLLQDFDDYEVRVIGDGCTDDSAAVVASLNDPRLHWTNLPHNTGTPGAPRNEGLRQARGRYIAWLGHDDLWLPWHLSSLLDCLKDGGDFACTLGVAYGPDGVSRAIALPIESVDHHVGISPSHWMQTRALADRVGAWSTTLPNSIDVDYLQRLWSLGMQARFCRRLTTIKFASVRWRPYADAALMPQPAWLERIRTDAHAVEYDILLDMAEHLATHDRKLTAGEEIRASLHGLARAALTAYGRRRWPASILLQWINRRRRGLPIFGPR
ncbi:MAG: glycosyltransferase family 2 protein [Chromatiales bacterium]|jgi:glycosyltransferase involved in cell wall biosynthesis|nr:glycosyltransferase family 2 protein [Chromatiales bacterium]MDX9767337.1 glycosyltransferase family 2 protein [Ectothiorhodospiraceae bacterium]